MDWDRHRWDFGGNRPEHKQYHNNYSNLIHPGSEMMQSHPLVGEK